MQIESIKNQAITNQQDWKNQKTDEKTTNEFEKLFTEVKKETPGTDSKVNSMIDDISKLKQMLDFELTPDNLEAYKKSVKSFLEYYTKNELKMDEYYVRDQKGYTKKLGIIRSIDNKLNNLTENMLETNQGHLMQLKNIGEIQGLLLNLRL